MLMQIHAGKKKKNYLHYIEWRRADVHDIRGYYLCFHWLFFWTFHGITWGGPKYVFAKCRVTGWWRDECFTAEAFFGRRSAVCYFSNGAYQEYWSTLGGDICKTILEVLNSGRMPCSLNTTHIALIPKVKNPSSVVDFRPISLCNVLYKIISKVLANRLKKILNHIISPVQSAFIPRRLITDNVVIAYETLHTMHTRLKGKKRFHGC